VIAAAHHSTQEFEPDLRAMTSKHVSSQYFTIGREEVAELIRRWGKIVALCNEQVQEHMVKDTKTIYSRASNRTIDLKSWICTLKDGKKIKKTRALTAVTTVLRRQIAYLLNLTKCRDNRTCLRKLKHWGSGKAAAKEARPTHDIVRELDRLVDEHEAAAAERAAAKGHESEDD